MRKLQHLALHFVLAAAANAVFAEANLGFQSDTASLQSNFYAIYHTPLKTERAFVKATALDRLHYSKSTHTNAMLPGLNLLACRLKCFADREGLCLQRFLHRLIGEMCAASMASRSSH